MHRAVYMWNFSIISQEKCFILRPFLKCLAVRVERHFYYNLQMCCECIFRNSLFSAELILSFSHCCGLVNHEYCSRDLVGGAGLFAFIFLVLLLAISNIYFQWFPNSSVQLQSGSHNSEKFDNIINVKLYTGSEFLVIFLHEISSIK